MKRLTLIAMLLIGSALGAHADNAIYDNITKHPRSGAVLQADTSDCSQQLGAIKDGEPTTPDYKRCMLARGWRYSHTVRDRSRQNGMYPDPDNPGLMCRDFTIGGVTGSSCSNF